MTLMWKGGALVDYPLSRAAYAVWKARPSDARRSDLRAAIRSEGGAIQGHGVIAWARKNLR